MTPIAPSSGISPPSKWPCTFCPEESDWGLDKCPECGHISLLKQAYQQGAWDKVRTLCADVLALSAESISAKSIIHKALDCQVAGILAQAQTHHDRGLWDKALSLCDEALRLSPHVVAAQELIAKTHSRRAADFLSRASDCLARTELDEALALCRTLQSEYPAQSEACGRLRHDISAALIARSEAAMSANDWQKAEGFAQQALELEPGNSDATRLRTDAQGKLRLKDLAGCAFAAYRARDLSGCRTACEAFLSCQKECGAHVEFTDASNNVIDFGTLPAKLRHDIDVERVTRAFILGQRLLKWVVACVVIAVLILGIAHWRKVTFEKRVRSFDTALQAGSYDAAKAIAPKIAGKYALAADLLTYFRAQTTFETALNGANAGLLQQYGATKWADLQAQRQAAEASAGVPAKGVEAYQHATSLLAECQTMADTGEKARKEKEAREKAIAEAKAREEREQAEKARAQDEKEGADGRLKVRVRSDLDTVIASIREASSGTRRLDARVVSAPEDLRAAANRGWADAQVLCGLCAMFGLGGFEKDRDEAVSLFRKAANQGHAYAQYQLGMAYGGDRDEENAVKWFRKAADQGLMEGQSILGSMYWDGVGVGKDAGEAAAWWRKAAEKGYTTAENNLGQCYLNGHGVSKDVQEGIKWLKRAAAKGDENARAALAEMQGASSQNTGSVGLEEDAVEQNNTGWRYLTGDGVQKDPREAAKWLLRAAQNGSPNAQCTLGVMCHEGVGVAQDDRQAVAWYRKSADQGFAQAQLNLGIMYNNGWGVSRNVAEAMKWFRLAARQGDETAIANLRALNVEW